MLKVQVCGPGEKQGQRGFTIVELMIATSVFAVITVIASATVVRFTNNFQRSLTHTTTQNANRAIIDDLTQTLQVNGHAFVPISSADDGSQGFCLNGVRYSYLPGRQLGTEAGDVGHALVKDILGGSCAAMSAQSLSSGSVSGKELLGQRMRIANLTVNRSTSGKVFTVTIKIAYGDHDLLCSRAIAGSCEPGSAAGDIASMTALQLAGLQCKGDTGSQFCSVSELSTTVKTRL